MTRHLPTGSRLELADECLGSALFDDGIDDTSTWAETGTAIHEFLENANADSEAALERIEDPVLRSVCEEIQLDGLGLDSSSWAVEVTFAWNWRTNEARELGRGLRRDYKARHPDEIVVTVDRVALLGDDGVFVGDWKCGFKRLRPARRHAQLRMGALAAARAYGRERAVVEWIRPREGQRALRDRAELDEFDLAEVAEQRRRMSAEIVRHREAGTEPRLRIGDHCERCPGRFGCRAQISALVALGRDPGAAIEEFVSGQLTPEIAERADQRLRAYEAVVKPVRAALRAWAIEHPIARGDGYVYGQHVVRKPIVDGHKTYDLLESEHNREVAHAAVDVKTSKAAIKDALRAVAPKRGLTKLFDATMVKLADAGAVTWKEERRVEEYRPADDTREIEE